MSVPDWLDDAAGFATCATLLTTGSQLVGTGVATLWAGGGGLVPLSLGMLSYLGAGAACGNIDVGDNSPPDGVTGCWEVAPGGFGTIEYKNPNTAAWGPIDNFSSSRDATKIVSTELNWDNSLSQWVWLIVWERVGGAQGSSTAIRYADQSVAARVQWRINVTNGTCGVNPGDPAPLPPGFKDPVQYTNPQTSCVYNVSPQGFAQETEGGFAGMVFKIEAAGPQTLAGAGVIGGCNFEPTLVYQPPGGGPPFTGPWDPTWPDWDGGGTPPWRDFLNDIVGGLIGNTIFSALESLFDTPLPATSKSIYAACQYKEDGTPEEFTINFPEQKYQDRVLDALTAQVDFAQQFFLWKTPICKDTPPPQTGDAVTINWISDQRSLASGDFLRKLFTYFDHNNSTLEATVAHWRDFTWQAGPVIVSCVGTQLGKPQVWAASEEEAKRVINHAAAIAGIDTSGAEWLVSAPKSSRYGVSGLMRVQRGVGGVLGITKRVGPSGFPEGLS